MTDPLKERAELIANICVLAFPKKPDLSLIESELRAVRDEAFREGRESVLKQQKCKDCGCSYESCCCNPIRELEARNAGIEEAYERAAKVAQCHETVNPNRQYADGYARAVNEILSNIRALKEVRGE